MKVWRGLLGAVLLLCAVLCVISVTALEDDGAHTHPICGATHTDIGDHTGECADVVWTAWDGTADIDYGDSNIAYVYLTDDAERTDKLAITGGKTLYLCLNGHSIIRTTDSANAFDAVIYAYDAAKLVLCDCKGGGTITHPTGVYGKGVKVGNSNTTGTFIMYGGEISGNCVGTSSNREDGAGVETHCGDFTMYGGKITNNRVVNGLNKNGGGVYAHTSGTFTMYGGEISNNVSPGAGGGVMTAGVYLKLYGGTISNNTAEERGGGVWTNMPLTISDGVSITGNKAAKGGGIYIYEETITITGGNITGNTATNGGGVYLFGDDDPYTLIISDSATIAGNTATEDGGGVYVESGANTSRWSRGYGTLEVDGGSITNNTAAGNGGGIYIKERGRLTIAGGNITDNTATGNGGGVYFNGESGKFNIYGNVNVTGNKKDGSANNVYLPGGQTIFVAGKLTGTTPIGVTTEVLPSGSAYVIIAQSNADCATPDKFQYENSNIAICAVSNGNTINFVACAHVWGDDWEADDTDHWHECSLCGEKKDTASHSGGTATCTEQAVCQICNQPYGNALGHDFTGGTWKNDVNGHWKKCSRCDATDTKSDHEWNDGEVTVDPTCTGTGEKTFTCTECHATKTETVDALDHDRISHNGQAATCTEDGWKPYVTCSRCEYTTYEKIDALDHDRISHDGQAATCTEDGWKPYVTCSRCEYTTYEKIDALDHDRIHHNAKAATCTEKGWNTYDTCSRCDYTTCVEIAASGHDFTGAAWQSDANRHWKQCSRCEATDEMADHTGGTATCRERAVCSVCSQAYGVRNPDNHVGGTEIRDMIDSTAEKAGHTGNCYCIGCNKKLSDGTTIPVISDLSTDKKSGLASAVEAMEKVMNDQENVYTDEQKERLVNSINAIKSALKSIENTEEAVKKVEAMPAAENTRPDDKTAIDAYEAAKSAYDALSLEEKRMAGEDAKAALDAMLKALTAYDVTYGNGSTWMDNNNGNGLIFTVNGYHKKFAGIVINGAVVDRSHYEIEAGSTIITLKSEYLQTLPAGKYTLHVQYTDGSTDGEDTFTITKNEPPVPSDSTDPSAPKNGDNGMIAVWISMAVVCAGILILLLLFFKKRKQETKK